MFARHDNTGYTDPLPGIRQKTLAYGEKTLMVEFRLHKGAVLPRHKHPHEQIGYLVSGLNGRKNADIVAYNQAVAAELSALGVEINDLHTLVAQDIQRYICQDKVHLSPDGVELCARQVSCCLQ